ncbi:MAG: cell division topological specificity factor MinE [Hominisplanchenecus sp.]|nr:cell division topological specificity factor MinE [Lachnospiraceae bacterium]
MKVFQVFSKKNSGIIARERMKNIILADRLCCTPETTDRIKTDIRQVLAKYMELNNTKIKIQLDISKEAEQGVKKYVKTIQIKGL